MGYVRLPAYWDQINRELEGFLPQEALRLLAERDRELEDAVGGLSFFQLSDFTALVDSAYPASDPTNGKFRGIGEALNYYGGLSSTSTVKIGVVSRATGYTETGAITWPMRVYMTGLLPGNDNTSSRPLYEWSMGSNGWFPQWDLGGFNAARSPNTIWMERMSAQSSSHAAGATSLFSATGHMVAEDCYFTRAATTGAAPILTVNGGAIHLRNCKVKDLWASPSGAADVVIDHSFFDMENVPTLFFGATSSNNSVYATGSIFAWGAANPTVSIGHTRIFVSDCIFGKQTITSSTSTTLAQATLTFTSATNALFFHVGGMRESASAGRPSDLVNIILTAVPNYDIDVANGGYFQINSAADAAATRNSRHVLRGTWETLSNVAATGCIARGPILMDVHIERGNGTVTNTLELKGPGVMANIAMPVSNGGAASVEIVGTALSTSVVNVAFSNPEAAVYVAGHKPFALDAASTKNILHLAGASLMPAAGTDLGVANNIVQT